MTRSLEDLYDDRRFVQGRIDDAERQKGLIGHRNADNEEYQGRERDIAGFEKTLAKIDEEIRELRAAKNRA